MSRSAVWSVLAVVATSTACTALAPTLRPGQAGGGAYPGTGASVVDARGAAGRLGGPDTTLLGRPRDRAERIPNDRGQLDAVRVCRSSAFPHGYIAVGYESSGSKCPLSSGRADSVGTVAVLVRYADAPIGTRLDVCVDQPIPNGWNLASDEGPGDPDACPGAARKGPTAERIRRDF